MALQQRFVHTGAAGGGDGTTNGTGAGGTNAYLSLATWLANAGGSATDDYHVRCQGGVDGSQADINLTPNLTTGTVLVESHPSEADGRYYGAAAIDTSHYYLSRASGFVIRPNEKNITLRGLQILQTGSDAFNSAINLNSAIVDGFVVEYCSIRSGARSCIGLNASNGTIGGSNRFSNNLFVLTSGSSVLDLGPGSTWSNAFTWGIYQNTLYSNGSKAGIRTASYSGAAAQVITISNNVIANTTAPFSLIADTGSLVTTTNYNWTESGAGGTTNEQDLAALASVFTGHGTSNSSDFTLLAALVTGGAVGSITDDKQGTTRESPPDAGAYEFISGGGGISGVLAATLDDATLSSAGMLALQAALTATLADATLSAAGALALKAALSVTLADATLEAAGVSVTNTNGELIATLESATLSAAGALALQGAVSATLADATLSSASKLAIAGALTATLENATLTSAAKLANSGALSVSLANAILSAQGRDPDAVVDDAVVDVLARNRRRRWN